MTYRPGRTQLLTPTRVLAILLLIGIIAPILWLNRDRFQERWTELTAREVRQEPAEEMVPEKDPSTPTPVLERPETVTSGSGETIRIVSWNIEWFPGRSPRASEETAARHLEATRRHFPTLEGDVYLLQEIGDLESLEQLIRGMTDFEVHILSRFLWRNQLSRQQLGILSRFPAKSAFYHRFEPSGDGPTPPRGFSFAAVDLPNGRPLLLYCVHLKSNLGDAERNIAIREESARQIIAHAREMKELYPDPIIVVGGDFNTLLQQAEMSHERTHALFTEAGYHWSFEGIPFEQRVTWEARGRFGDASFDHFFIYGGPTATAFLLPNPDLSDHNPIAIEITLD